jgi:Arc/MetJ family transcription regulator
MRPSSALKRKTFFVDERAIARARRALGVETDAEAVRLSLERVAEMEQFWRFMRRSRGKLTPGTLGEP